MRFFVLAAAICCSVHPTTLAVDLSKVDRTIQKEPAYQGAPRYCLLVLGPQAATRVWLILDGQVLYVDRNGNGDLTEANERCEAKNEDGYDSEFRTLYRIGELTAGNRTHRMMDVTVYRYAHFPNKDDRVSELLKKQPDAVGFAVNADVEMSNLKSSNGPRILQLAGYRDYHGLLHWAADAKSAPIIHFDGPLTIAMYGKDKARIGRDVDLALAVGTPGLGPGTTAWIAYQHVIPEDAYPKVEIVYPSMQPTDAPIKELYELKERC